MIEKYHRGFSSAECEVKDFIEKLGFVVETNNRSILNGLEIDMVIEDRKLCIEYNGLHWHSSAHGKSSNYHLDKTNGCESAGYKLIHIFEDEWIYNKEFIKEILLINLGIKKYIIPKNNIIKMDRRFWNKNDFPNFKVIGITEPRMYYVKRDKRVEKNKSNSNLYKIWDCGDLILSSKN